MSTIIVAVIVLTVSAILILLRVSNERKISRSRLKKLLLSFSQSAIQNKLSISGQEIINDNMIGLDAVNRKLLVVYKNNDNLFDNVVIDLNEVKQCSVESVSALFIMTIQKKAGWISFSKRSYYDLSLIQETVPTTSPFIPIIIVCTSFRSYTKKLNNGRLILSLY